MDGLMDRCTHDKHLDMTYARWPTANVAKNQTVNKSFENIVGKEEIAHNKQFLLFPQCFPPFRKAYRQILTILKLLSAIPFQVGRV